MKARFQIAAVLCITATLVAGVGVFVTGVGSAPIRPSARQGPSDAWLSTKAKIAILTSVGNRGTAVQLVTADQTITLFGKVASEEDKKSAETSARAIEGVRDVRNWLQVARVAEDAPVGPSDSMLQTEVGVALIAMDLKAGGDRVHDHRHEQELGHLSRSNISVRSVDKGTVLLVGRADNLGDHLRAIETAKSIPGVRAVRSQVQSPDFKAVHGPRFLGQ